MSTYSPSLRIELITTGDQAGTWGATTNTNLGTLIESSIAGYTSVAVASANQAFTALNGAPDEARHMTIALTTSTGANFAVYAPPAEKTYIIYNASSYTATIYNSTVIGNTTAAGTGVAIPAGKTMTVWSEGTNFRVQNDHLPSLTLTTPLAVAQGGTGVTTSTGTGSTVLSASPTFTGTPIAPTASYGTSTTQLATTAFVQAALQALHPVGSIYINATDATNPGTLFGFGTWAAFGAGRVPVGFNAGNPLFDTAEETGGSADAITVSHTHSFSATTGAAGSHNHLTGGNWEANPFGLNTARYGYQDGWTSARTANGGGTGYDSYTSTVGNHTHSVSGTTDSAGSSGTNANYQPYITVYMWKRTA
jgi:hypothetical protein